ncbi:MAG: hypothetical protein IPM29_31505 [Planctomycetes bacterium]|nr:hypothetical protein [Planctomycetota bacterium]
MIAAAFLAAVLPQVDPSAAQQQPRAPEPLPIPRTLILRRGDHRIDVDGNLQDWPELPPILVDDLRQLSGTALGALRGRDDLAARLFAMWDDDALYLAAVVLDDWHVRLTRQSPQQLEIPPADALTITIDPNRDTEGIGPDRGREDDVTIWLADVEDQGSKVIAWDTYRGSASFVEGAEARVGRDDERRTTIYELRLPWAEVLGNGRHPEPRTVFDVQFVFDDFDEPTDPMPQTRAGWNFGMGTRIDPGLFGSAMLADVTPDELGVGGFPMPAFPEPAPRTVPLPPAPEYWADLRRRLQATTPVVVERAVVDPSAAGGTERRDALQELERHLADFPRVDFLRFQMCVDRRMNRECAGIAAAGLPSFWDAVLTGMQPALEAPPPDTGYRLIRLPQGGWVVRSRTATFAIDPAGYGVDKSLDELVDFVLLTCAIDPSRRNDQLALRLLGGTPRRRILQHLATHLPAFSASDQVLVVPGNRIDIADLTVDVIGRKDADGHVSSTVGYWIRWPDGSDLVVSALELDETSRTPDDRVEALLLSPHHPRARIVAQRLQPDLVVLDDVLQCSVTPGSAGRVPLDAAWALQAGLRPLRSLLLAPGESQDVAPARD